MTTSDAYREHTRTHRSMCGTRLKVALFFFLHSTCVNHSIDLQQLADRRYYVNVLNMQDVFTAQMEKCSHRRSALTVYCTSVSCVEQQKRNKEETTSPCAMNSILKFKDRVKLHEFGILRIEKQTTIQRLPMFQCFSSQNKPHTKT